VVTGRAVDVEFARCPKCKRPILGGGKVCPGCGTPLGGKRVAATRPPGGSWFPLAVAAGVVFSVVALYHSGWRPSFRAAPPAEPPPPVTTSAGDGSKFGLDEEKRHAVYQELLLAEDHAQVEAERRYPPPEPGASTDRWQRRAETREQFRKQAEEEDKRAIAKHYGLSDEQLRAIADEGFTKDWPRPARKSIR